MSHKEIIQAVESCLLRLSAIYVQHTERSYRSIGLHYFNLYYDYEAKNGETERRYFAQVVFNSKKDEVTLCASSKNDSFSCNSKRDTIKLSFILAELKPCLEYDYHKYVLNLF